MKQPLFLKYVLFNYASGMLPKYSGKFNLNVWSLWMVGQPWSNYRLTVLAPQAQKEKNIGAAGLLVLWGRNT